MRIDDIIQPHNTNREMAIIAEQCSDFLRNSEGEPLLKNLSSTYDDLHKVKVRKRKQRKSDSRDFANIFNEAFEDEMQNIRERSVFTNGLATFTESTDPSQEAFYIFPIDGYEFMYSTEVENSSVNYKAAFDAILEKLGADKGKEVIAELLKFNYNSSEILEGIKSGSEIIIYNIPYFYAIRRSTVDNYNDLYNNLKDIRNGV